MKGENKGLQWKKGLTAKEGNEKVKGKTKSCR